VIKMVGGEAGENNERVSNASITDSQEEYKDAGNQRQGQGTGYSTREDEEGRFDSFCSDSRRQYALFRAV